MHHLLLHSVAPQTASWSVMFAAASPVQSCHETRAAPLPLPPCGESEEEKEEEEEEEEEEQAGAVVVIM